MRLDAQRWWQMNYRLIYWPYTGDTTAIFDDLIDIDITPLNANTDDLFSFSGRKCTITMPYDATARSVFFDNDDPNVVYPDYMRGQFDLRDLDNPDDDDALVFCGMAKLEFIEIDELRSEIKIRLSDALDVWIDIAKRTDFTIPEGDVKTIAMRAASGDYTVVDFMQEIMIGMPIQMQLIDLFNFLPIYAQNILLLFDQYQRNFTRWLMFDSDWDSSMTPDQITKYIWIDTEGFIRISIVAIARQISSGQWLTGATAEIRYWSTKISQSNPFQPVEELSGYVRNIIAEPVLKSRLKKEWLFPASEFSYIDNMDLSENAQYTGSFLPRNESLQFGDNEIIFPLNDIIFSGDLELDPVTIHAGSYNYAKILRAMMMANRLTVFSGSDAITIKQHLIDPTADTSDPIVVSDDDITHLQIRGTMGNMNTLDDISALGGARALIVPLQQIYRDILGNFRKQIRFSLRSSIANNLQMFSKLQISGRIYFVTSIAHPDIDGTTEIIAIGER